MSKKSKNLGGRPKIEIDIKLAGELCKINCTRDEICKVLKVDDETLNARLKDAGYDSFSTFFEEKAFDSTISKRRKIARVEEEQFNSAIEDRNPTILIWLGKQYLGQRDHEKELRIVEKEVKVPSGVEELDQESVIEIQNIFKRNKERRGE